MASELYKEYILDLYKNSKNKGNLEKCTNRATKHNSICGDEIEMQLEIEKGILKNIRFNGEGCVISQVSASMLTEKVKGMKINEIKQLKKEDLLEMLKIPISYTRMRCALLSLEALKDALK